MLIINNTLVEELLDMQTCIDVQEEAFRGLATSASVMRPRIDVYVPCDFEDSYYRWGQRREHVMASLHHALSPTS